jgi:3-oxoacyl-[acyl-carrier-protein] synthase-3
LIRTKITGIGSYVPEGVVSNKDIEKMVDTSDEWITTRTGIRERRIVTNGQVASDLAVEASKRALNMAGVDVSEVDLIIVATMSGDMPMPSTASRLQHKIGAKNVAAMDINAACSGFLYALTVADNFIRSNSHLYKKVLLVGTEVLSSFLDWEDRSTCILFGDGAGAVVLEPTHTDSGVISTKLHSNGGLWDLVHIPGGGSSHPPSEETLRNRMHYITMKGNETFKVAVRTLTSVVLETLNENNLDVSQIKLLIPHQANIRILQAVAQRLGLPQERVFINIERYGNTSAASIPLALDEAVRSERISEGDYILMEAFGGGLTWASALIKW